MTAPDTYRTVLGEEIVLSLVPAEVRRAAITIAFATAAGPWWEQITTAREVLRAAGREVHGDDVVVLTRAQADLARFVARFVAGDELLPKREDPITSKEVLELIAALGPKR